MAAGRRSSRAADLAGRLAAEIARRPTDGRAEGERLVRTERGRRNPVAPLPGGSQPRYPDILRQAGVEGEVLAQFVVDTSGRAEMNSYKVLKTTHELFGNAVKNALPGMRFIPAEVGGRKVRQLVQQPFTFAISK